MDELTARRSNCQSPWHRDASEYPASYHCFADGKWQTWCHECADAAPYRLAVSYAASVEGAVVGAIFEAEKRLVYLRQALEAYRCDMARLAGQAEALRDTGGLRGPCVTGA